MLAIGQSQIQILFLLVADHPYIHGRTIARPDRVAEIAGVMHRLVVDLHDYVSGAEACLFRTAAFLDRAHQHSIAILDTEELSQLRADIFHSQTAARRGGYHHHVDRRNVDVRDVDLGHLKVKVLHVMAHGELLVLVAQLNFHRHRLPVTAQAEGHDAARRHLVDHATQLRSTFNRSAVHGQNHVMLFDARLACRSVLVDHGYLNALFFFQLQRAQPFVGHIRNVDPKV